MQTHTELSRTERGRFNTLMQSTYRKVFNMAFRLSGSKSDAEDLTQEAFYRAYRSFADYDGDKPFENWIFRIVNRLFLDMLRTRRRRVQAVSYDAPLMTGDDVVKFEVADESGNAERLLVEGTFSEDLQQVLDTLTDEQRMLVTLADIEGMPYQDIAEMLGKPVGTIRSRLHRTHKLMRKRIVQLRSQTNDGSGSRANIGSLAFGH